MKLDVKIINEAGQVIRLIHDCELNFDGGMVCIVTASGWHYVDCSKFIIEVIKRNGSPPAE